jgi:hypothetical protein
MEQRAVLDQDEELLNELFPQKDDEHFIPFMIQAKGRDVLRLVKALLLKVNNIKISVWHKDSPIVTIPSLYGGLAAALFPLLSVFSVVSLLALDCRIIVEKRVE